MQIIQCKQCNRDDFKSFGTRNDSNLCERCWELEKIQSFIETRGVEKVRTGVANGWNSQEPVFNKEFKARSTYMFGKRRGL
jgi:hypothetical protein